MRRSTVVLLSLAGLLGASHGGARAAEPGDAVPAAWVAIAEVEHRRGDPAGLDPYLVADADPVARRRAIVALGRIGDRKGVESRLRELLRRGGDDVPVVVWAAGISAIPGLAPELVALLPAKGTVPNASTATVLEALGRLKAAKDARLDEQVLPWLGATDVAVAAAAHEALMRLGADRQLAFVAVRIGIVAGADDVAVRRAAAVATWRLAGLRRQAESAAAKNEGRKPSWDGVEGLARIVARVTRLEKDPETRIALFRALNALTPKTLDRVDHRTFQATIALLAALSDPDPRIRGDIAMRLGAGHDGPDVRKALETLLEDSSPLVQQTAEESLDAIDSKSSEKREPRTPTPRPPSVEELRLGVLMLRVNSDTVADPEPIEVDDGSRVRAFLRTAILRSQHADRLAQELLPKLSPSLRAFVLEVLGENEKASRSAVAVMALADDDAGVRGQAAALFAKAKGVPDAAGASAIAAAYGKDSARTGVDARIGVLDAIAERDDWLDEKAAPSAAFRALIERGLSDPAPTVRLAARKVAEKVPALAARAKEEDATPNEWRRLPRPKAPILGLDLTRGEGWLTEAEILRLAETIRASEARVVLETDRGTMRFALDPVNAPVHCANFVLCAAAGVYDGTPWHRVVPAFVIQGGDPRGDGSGDAGYAIPDEINPTRFERGVLGMPKSTKDTGGCQVFVMHCAAPHLDGAYTAFGRVVDGIDVVDRILVGDRIRSARVEAGAPSPR